MRWQLRELDPDNSLAIPILTMVLAYRDQEQIVDYGNGYQGPERRLIVALDRFDGLDWQHQGSGKYIGYYPIPSVLQWQNSKIDPARRYLVRVASDNFTSVDTYQPIPKDIYLAKVSDQPHGLVWQCYQAGHRFKSTDDFIQRPRFISVPSNIVSHWQVLPQLDNHQWFR